MTTASYRPAESPSSNFQPATRSRSDSLKALPTTLNSEWIKLSTIRSNKAVLVLTVALNGMVSWAVANFVTEQGELFVDEVFAFSTIFTAVFAAVAGILIFSSESQHGTLAPTLTAQPARLVIAAAKMLTTAAISGLLVWWLVVENLLNAFVDPLFSRFLPFVAGNGLLAIEDDIASAERLNAALTRTEDALVFGGYATVALIIGTVLLYRRDTN